VLGTIFSSFIYHCQWVYGGVNYELQCLASSIFIIYLLPDDGLVIEAETCCHLVTLNKINIHNTSGVLTCESLLLTCTPAWCLFCM